VTDGRNNILDLNGTDIAISLMLEKEQGFCCYKYTVMYHPSEWARFFDENTGRYRCKHKGSGVIRDTLMIIGKVFKDNVKNVAKKTAEKATKTIAEKAGQKIGELAVEKGSKQIKKQMQKLRKQKMVSQDAKKKLTNILQNQKPVSQDAEKKLANILQNQVPKKSDDALVKLNRILANEI